MNIITIISEALQAIPENTRARMYRIATAAILILGIYGIVDEQQAAGWIALAGAVFTSGMASANTSVRQLPPPSIEDSWRDRGATVVEPVLAIFAAGVIVVAVLILAGRGFLPS